MKSAYRPLVVIGLAVVVAGVMMIQLRANRPELVNWDHDFQIARTRARATNTPLLAYFTATWCEPCQKMRTTTFADERVESALRKFTIVKVDLDANKDLAMKYRAESIPMFVILDDDGNVKRQMAGYMDSEQFLTWLKG